jgi:hypothetical protein
MKMKTNKTITKRPRKKIITHNNKDRIEKIIYEKLKLKD